MSIHSSVNYFIEYLEGGITNPSLFISKNYIALRCYNKEMISGLDSTLNYYKNKKIYEIEIEEEDSHTLLYFKDLNDIKYITKIRFDENDLILSLVEEIYDEAKNKMVIEIEYDGSKYSGMQKQAINPLSTIQGQIEFALKKMLNRDVETTIASRTDSGVHAKGQIVSFDSFGIEANKYIYALNNILNGDIRVKNAYKRSQLFHARYDVVQKEYEYIIDLSEYSVYRKDYVWYQNIKDLNLFENELKSLVGTHDFTAFCRGENDNPIRTIYDIYIERIDDLIHIHFIGNGFLHNMIRFIIGSAIDSVNNNKPSLEELLIKKDKNLTPKLAPSSGLYLLKIKY